MSRGFIYILTHTRMPGIVKIGYTETTLEERVGAINSATGVPGDFHIAYAREVENPFELERQIHSRMSVFRYIEGREFFEIKLEAARLFVDETIRGLEFKIKPDYDLLSSFTNTRRLGQLIREERNNQGLLQTELAGLSCVGNRFIVELEGGKPTAQIGKVLNVLGVLGFDIAIQPRNRRHN